MANKHRVLQLSIFIMLSPNESSDSLGGVLGKVQTWFMLFLFFY